MINIKDKKDCCGCSACVQKCPKQCISLKEDNEGFLYPQVDQSKCIDCHLCEKVCPFLNQNEPINPIKIFAAKNPDEEKRMQSSSGGVFSAIAESIIDEGGVVFGASFNKDWVVCHSFTESKEGLSTFRGSKYVQSQIDSSYVEAEKMLKIGRKVLFSGTPCQISGLKKYLQIDYENLLCVDIVCHGVPSPLVFKEYLRSELKRTHSDILDTDPQRISKILFRDKRLGWQRYGLSIYFDSPNMTRSNSIFQEKKTNPYLVGFLSDVFLRQSCYTCPIKNGKSGSDITLADYWGIKNEHPDFYDDKGVSCVIINTAKGEQIYKDLLLENEISTLNQFIKRNSAYYKSPKRPDNRNKFWKGFKENGVEYATKKYARLSLRESMLKIIGKLGIVPIIKKILKR